MQLLALVDFCDYTHKLQQKKGDTFEASEDAAKTLLRYGFVREVDKPKRTRKAAKTAE